MTKYRTKKSSLESQLTDWLSRFAQAIGLLCGGPAPDFAMCAAWTNNESEELQQWVLENSKVAWCSGIGTIEAATIMADTPEEDLRHAPRHLKSHERAWDICHDADGVWRYVDKTVDDGSKDVVATQSESQSARFASYQEAVEALKADHGAAPETIAVVPNEDDEIATDTLFDVNLVLDTTASRTVRVAADTKENAFMLAQRHVCETGCHGFEINEGNFIRSNDVYCGGAINDDVEEVPAIT